MVMVMGFIETKFPNNLWKLPINFKCIITTCLVEDTDITLTPNWAKCSTPFPFPHVVFVLQQITQPTKRSYWRRLKRLSADNLCTNATAFWQFHLMDFIWNPLKKDHWNKHEINVKITWPLSSLRWDKLLFIKHCSIWK